MTLHRCLVFKIQTFFGGFVMSYHDSLCYCVLRALIEDMSESLIPTVELILYDYLRCNLIEYNEFLALMELYRYNRHDLESEDS